MGRQQEIEGFVWLENREHPIPTSVLWLSPDKIYFSQEKFDRFGVQNPDSLTLKVER
jgi:hypothetical protein